MCTIKRICNDYIREIGDFECEINDKPMEDFLKSEALKYDECGEGNTFLLVEEKSIIGYYTIKCNAIEIRKDNVEKVYPAIEICRIAIDRNYRGKGYGASMMEHIINTICNLKQEVGIKCILLFSVANAVEFYKKFNFEELPSMAQVLPCWESSECVGMYAVI